MTHSTSADIAVIGAGAAGLFAAIHAGRAGARVIALDGARTLGAKILVAGGGRCNVTHHAVSERDYCGSTLPAIRNVLRRFPVEETVAFFRARGVELKREDTGKLFPVSDSAKTVLRALLTAAEEAGVEIVFPRKVRSLRRDGHGWELTHEGGGVRAARVILAAGGQSLPKSGSDGSGMALARSAGLRVTERVFPALVPLTLPPDHWLCGLSGIATPARLSVHGPSGKTIASTAGPVLMTHFGLSGPAVLDISRRLLDARLDDAGATLRVALVPGADAAALDAALAGLGPAAVGSLLKSHGLAERLSIAACAQAGLTVEATGSSLRKEARKALVRVLTALEVPVIGARGWNYAEVTAGGVPLSELHLKTMEARPAPGLHLCGEVCDVDGRIGGFNFQWAWASGFVAGTSAAAAAGAGTDG